MRKILLIEDDKIKIEKLSQFLQVHELTIKESFHSGLKEIISGSDIYDFLLLDMTIPLWEKEGTDLSGNYEQFGGERVLREMKRRKKILPTILVTMFDVFTIVEGNLTFKQLDAHLLKEFSDFYLGAVFYNASDDTWKSELENFIKTIPVKNND